MNYYCNCKSRQKDKWHKTKITPELLCVDCGHYAFFIDKKKIAKRKNEILRERDIVNTEFFDQTIYWG